MDTQDWIILTAIHKNKSLSKASQQLFISQPALTRRVQNIEKEFHVTILQRTSQGVTFTAQGSQLAYYAEDMLKRYGQIKEGIKQDGHIGGMIHIVASSSQSQFFLPGLMQSFKKKYPMVQFELESLFSEECIARLQNHSADIAFFRGNHNGHFIREFLLSHHAYVAYSKPFEIQDLPFLPYISVDADHYGTSIRESWWYDVFNVAPREAMSVKNINICYEMVRYGLGFGIFLNRDLFNENDNVFHTQIYYKDGSPVTRNDWIGFRSGAETLEPTKSFIEFTKEYVHNHANHLEIP